MKKKPAMANMIKNSDLFEMEVTTLRHLVDALAALKNADNATGDGLASDHLHNAAAQIRIAMRMVGG